MLNGLGRLAAAAIAFLACAGAAAAQDGEAVGRPVPWQIGFQEAVTPVMHQITNFHTFVTIIIFGISLFVLALLIYVMWRFNERAHPSPTRTSHNTALEVAWTVIPIVILVVIAIPSFRILFAQYDPPDPDLTIKATGNQWYWSYEYPDEDGLLFDSVMVPDEELEDGQPRLLTVDNDVVVPVNKNVRVLVTASDVIHNWAMPSFGIKLDAVPGRLMETWFNAERSGVYHGQCSELCGSRHAFMPITVRVVSEEEYAEWLAEMKEQFAARPAKRDVARLDSAGAAGRN